MNKLIKAMEFAAKAHNGQKRLNGEPYITHPFSVAAILADFGHTDEKTLIVALLHDVLEDTIVKGREISRAFGNGILHCVREVTKEGESGHFYLRTKTGFVVKMADRIHNILTCPNEKVCECAAKTDDLLDTFRSAFKKADPRLYRFLLKTHNANYKKIPKEIDEFWDSGY